MTGTAVATTDRKGITALLQTPDARARIEPMLRGVEYNRVLGEVYLACGENPEILQCTPSSVIRAVARAVSWGLSIGETVHLVPFNVNVAEKGEPKRFEKRLKAIQDYKGKIELIVGCGAARSIDAQVVYAKEPFAYTQGTNPSIAHTPATKASDRGEMIGAYAVAYHGALRPPHIVYMPYVEIDQIRQRHSKQWKEGGVPPWYARKTVVHQVAKLLPKNQRLAKVLAVLEEDEIDPEALPGAPVATIEPPPPAAAAADEHELDDRWVEEQDAQRPMREPGEE